jgi:ABC-type transport system involved in multi-copper enzyme maturation permease subunit
MRHALVIARRELEDKRFVALAAAAFAVLPFLLATIPGLRGRNGAADVIATAAGMLAIGFTGGLALVLGGNVIGRDLAENRLSFYFSRPLSAASIWFGKVTAALALIVAAFVIIVAPARLGAPAGWRSAWEGGPNAPLLALVVVGGSFVLFLVAHVIGSFVRSRSAWIGVDFAALCVAAYAASLMFGPILSADANRASKWLAAMIGCGVMVALIGGGAWQLSRGRTDRKRSHVALSQFVWIVIAVTLAIAGAFVGWLMSATPKDITDLRVSVPSPGSWVILGGETRGRIDYRSVFVYNLDSGAYSRISHRNLWRADLTADGKRLIVARANRKQGTADILERPVERNDEQPTGLTLHLASEYITSPNGDTIAFVDRDLLSVYSVPQRRSMGSVRLTENLGHIIAMYFASPTSVRLISITPPTQTLYIGEFDLDHHRLQETGAFPNYTRKLFLRANADGSRLLVRDLNGRLFVIDGRTAAVYASIDAPDAHGGTFLPDGAIAVSGPGKVDIFDAHGSLVRSLPLPVVESWSPRATRDGRILVAGRERGQPWETFIVDPSSGAVQRIPATAMYESSWYRRDPRQPALDLPTFFMQKNQLVRWNYAAQKPEVILPPSS